MPITLKSREDGRILVYTIVGRWEIHDVVEKFKEELAFRERASRTVHLLVDLRLMQNVPAKLITIRGAPGMSHTTSGYVVMIGASPMARILGQSVFRVLGFDRARFFDIEELAWTFLNSVLTAEV